MDGQETPTSQGIQVISRAADILRLLGEETEGLSLGQIARSVGLPRSTVQRIVSALALEGLISTEKGSGGIKLGPVIQSLAQATVTDIRDKLRPVMKDIAAETGETVDLAVLEGTKMRFIDQIVGSQRLRTVSRIGEAFPLTTTANGKAALACKDVAEAKELVVSEKRALNGTSRPLRDILAEIDSIRDGELARDESEHTEGICALGFAVQDQDGMIYALSVPVPSSRYQRIKDELSAAIVRSRDSIGTL